MSYQYLVGVTIASNIIRETCTAIWDCLSPVVLPSKLKKKDWLTNDFENKWNFPHYIMEPIDGKHVIQIYNT